MRPFDEVPETIVRIPAGDTRLDGDLARSSDSTGLVVFVDGSRNSRSSVRNRYVAHTLQQHGFATLVVDLATPGDAPGSQYERAEVEALARRLVTTVDWLRGQNGLDRIAIGILGAGTGAAAALVAAADRPHSIQAVVSRGGRPDLATHALPRVTVPSLFIVGALDPAGLGLHRAAMTRMRGPVSLEIVAGAGPSFEEPGALSEVADYAADWFHASFDPTDPAGWRPLGAGA
jgi:dienelactone hydrolase